MSCAYNTLLKKNIFGRDFTLEHRERVRTTDEILKGAYESIYGNDLPQKQQRVVNQPNEDERTIIFINRDLVGRNLEEEYRARVKFTDDILKGAYESIYRNEKLPEEDDNTRHTLMKMNVAGRNLEQEHKERVQFTNDILKGAYESFY